MTITCRHARHHSLQSPSAEKTTAAKRWTVAYGLDAVLRTITYMLQYEGRPPDSLEWRMSRGDLRAIEGGYVLETLEPNVTRSTWPTGSTEGRGHPTEHADDIPDQALDDSEGRQRHDEAQHGGFDPATARAPKGFRAIRWRQCGRSNLPARETNGRSAVG